MEYDELAQHLESLQRESCYRVDAVLKESSHEVTQRVFFVGGNGTETGPFIRKFIRQDSGLGSAYQRIFEAQQNGRRFKHLPDVLECYAHDEQLIVVMEYVRGDTLKEIVYQNDPSLDLAIDTFPQICDAATELHTNFIPPIIHRDLKPSNIILTGQGLALIDFGISREYREQAECDTTRFGTREFAPPEQYGFGQTGVYSDVYSLGMVLYFCLTEQIPSPQTRAAAFRDPRIPESVRAVIEKATALDPSMRFETADSLKQAFLEAASNPNAATRAFPAEPATIGQHTQSAKRSRKILAITATLVFLALVALFAFGLVKNATSNAGGNSREAATQSDASVSTKAGRGTASGETASGEGSADRTAMGGTTSSESAAGSSSAGGSESNRATSSESASGGATSNESAPSESDIVEGLEIAGLPKNGFDQNTNVPVSVAGVTFQIPRYFMAQTSSSDTGPKYYYGETGSSTAMIMTTETKVNADESEVKTGAWKDSYLEGVAHSSDAFAKIVAVTDCELAGYPARIVAFTGTIKNIPINVKMAYFYNPSISSVGAVLCGQTTNAQFDYSQDFAKVITSAAAE